MTYRPNKPKRDRYRSGPAATVPEPTKQESKEKAVSSEMTKEEKQRLLDLFMAREDLEGTDALVKSWIGNGLRLQAESDAKLKEWDDRRKQLDQERQALVANFNATVNQTNILTELAARAQASFEATSVTPGALNNGNA